MLPYLVLGIALLAGILLAGRWYVSADPKILVRALKWVLVIVVVAVIVFFVVSGRFAWAVMALPALLPWVMRFRQMARTAKAFRRMSQAGAGHASGQTSDIETRTLRMRLDHDSGRMSGDVIDGRFAGRALEDLTLDELLDLLDDCRRGDTQSVTILESYLDRERVDWRQHQQARHDGAGSAHAGGSAGSTGGMSRAEALEVLGLEEGASPEDIRSAHRRLIAGLHPDHGGSSYLAAKINEAKDVLLKS